MSSSMCLPLVISPLVAVQRVALCSRHSSALAGGSTAHDLTDQIALVFLQ